MRSVFIEAVPDPEEIVDAWFSWEQIIEEEYKGYIPAQVLLKKEKEQIELLMKLKE